MSIEQIVTEAEALPEEQRKDLIGRLLAIGRDRREEATCESPDRLEPTNQ